MTIIKRFVLGPLATNCYLIEVDDKIILIDAGVDAQKVVSFLDKKNLGLDYILLTHTHYDHIASLDYLTNIYPSCIVVVGKEEQAFLKIPEENLSIFSDEYYTYYGTSITYEELDYKSLGIKIFKINGHSLKSVCIYFEKDKTLFSGDTLFNSAIGRWDFNHGSEENLRKGIKKHILTLPKDVEVHPGHGFSTTVKREIDNKTV